MKYLSDDELIYLIKQNNKEAEELLFLRYKTNTRLINTIIKPYVRLVLDENEIESKIAFSLRLAMSNYSLEKGKFIAYFSTVLYREIFKDFRKKSGIFDIYSTVEFNDELMTPYEEIQDSSVDGVNALDLLKKYNEEYYYIVYYWLRGETYKSIGVIMNSEPRQIEYKLQRAISYLRSLLIKK